MVNATHLEYRVAVRGIWGRNRTEKFQTFTLATVPVAEPLPLDAVSILAATKLAEVKFRAGRWNIRRTAWEYKTHSDGVQIKTCCPMDDLVLDGGSK
jgi:hypothetical protein